MNAQKLCSKFYRWYKTENGVAAVESALLFPTLIMMLVSMVDIGNAFLTNQKLINATQTTADLITRSSNPTLADRQNAITAGKVMMDPAPLDTYQYRIVSYAFDAAGDAAEIWREESGGMGDTGAEDLTGLGNTGEGVVAVHVTYTYQPFFTGFLIGPIPMQERAYLRGRQTSVVGLPL